MKKTTMRVEGMTCDHCVQSISRALQEMEGVTRAAVSLDQKTAVVEHQDDKPTPEQMLAVIDEEGYSASTL
jgi:copper chaperone